MDRYKGLDGYSIVNWVNKATYLPNESMVVFYFSKVVVELTNSLSEKFTRYYLHQVSKFKNKYSILLYEILVKWISFGKKIKKTLAYHIVCKITGCIVDKENLFIKTIKEISCGITELVQDLKMILNKN